MPKTRVLVVEDDIHLLSGIRDILELEEYAVWTAMNGVEGLRILNEHRADPPDVIVSDIMMPHLDGFGFLEEVRRQDYWVGIPFIFLTARGDKTDRYKGVMMGADIYLPKPFDADELLIAVSSSLMLHLERTRVNETTTQTEFTGIQSKIMDILDHELHMPLEVVENYTDLLRGANVSQLSEDGVLELLHEVNSGADELRRLIENFIILVEIDSGDAEKTFGWRRREIPALLELVRDAHIQIAQPDTRPRDFILNVPRDFPPFTADVQFLTTAVRELLDNGARYSPEHTQVILTAREDGDWIEISVQDSGWGIDQTEHENIWMPFYQVNRHHTSSTGVGAGLAIVDGVAKIHGGSRSVVSEPGKGSTFTIRLPKKPPAPVPLNDDGSVAAEAGSPEVRTRVLVVEDDAHLLSGIRDILELEEYEVLTAMNGVEGLRLLNEHRDSLPEVIVSDIMMPHLDGFGFLKEVRAQDRLVTVPFIFLTAKGEKRDRFEGAMLGASFYLTKPFDAEDLLVAVASSLRLQRRRTRAQRERRKTELSAFKRKILTILNHEFRTPLTLVVAYADMLKDYNIQTMGDDEVLEFLKGVNSGADRLHRLIENFILLVEIDRGDAETVSMRRRRKVSSLRQVVHHAWKQVDQPVLRPREYVLDVAPDLPVFVMDDHFLMIAIRELLDNAAKFSKENDRIVLTARSRGNCIEIAVSDPGRGMVADELDKIWQPFYQIDREQFEDQGAGSGLAIVDGIIKMHGGSRSVVSEKGKGSTFTIALPLQPESN